MACESTTRTTSATRVTPAAARRMFARERAKFARWYPWVAQAELVLLKRRCVESGRCALRDLAYATFIPLRVSLLERALKLPDANVRGLIRHELGHLSDRHVWRRGREQRADDLAEMITGVKIKYDVNDIQTTGRGIYPRPRYLHR